MEFCKINPGEQVKQVDWSQSVHCVSYVVQDWQFLAEVRKNPVKQERHPVESHEEHWESYDEQETQESPFAAKTYPVSHKVHCVTSHCKHPTW